MSVSQDSIGFRSLTARAYRPRRLIMVGEAIVDAIAMITGRAGRE
jgi:hypothetical protein